MRKRQFCNNLKKAGGKRVGQSKEDEVMTLWQGRGCPLPTVSSPDHHYVPTSDRHQHCSGHHPQPSPPRPATTRVREGVAARADLSRGRRARGCFSRETGSRGSVAAPLPHTPSSRLLVSTLPSRSPEGQTITLTEEWRGG